MKRSSIKRLGVGIVIVTFLLLLASCSSVKEEIVEKTANAQWFEDNMGWFVGIPSGIVLSIIGEAIFLIKRNKGMIKEQIKNVAQREEIAKELANVKKTNAQLGKFITTAENKVIEIDNKMDSVIGKAEEMTKTFESVVNAIKENSAKVDKLVEILTLISSQDKDLVANGIAEKINAINNDSK